MGSGLKIIAKGETDVGQVRAVNQDAIHVDTNAGIFIVADGMGGHAGGEIASAMCIENILEWLKKEDLLGITLPKKFNREHHAASLIQGELARAINHASHRIYERALEEPMLKGMGTTATALKIIGGTAYVAHVGDSRLYLIRCGLLYQISHDHSLVSEQLRAGLLTDEQASLHHLKNVITRSVGYQEEEEVDTYEIALQDADLLVLCSDGLHGEVGNQELSLMVSNLGVEAVPQLIKQANENGGQDNISIIVVEIKVSS